MKPEDQAAFSEACKDWSVKPAGKDLGEYFFNAGMAHRDAQPAVAVNEKMLDALKLYIAHAGEPECAIWRHVQAQVKAAIAAAEDARKKQ